MLISGPVRTDLDFDAPGKRAGFLDVTWSDNDHAFSSIRVPVGVARGGDGPTLLLTAGNHGDEYEGQVILNRLMQSLDPTSIQGRVIMLPALNAPAVRARARVSPLDGANMNRSFPGDPARGPTGAIAAFVTEHLIPTADAILDFHSGGTATRYVDCGFLCIGPDAPLNRANRQMAETFGAPFTMVCPIDGTGGDFDTAAHLRGTRFLSCELGGAGRFSPASFQAGWTGTLRVLVGFGLVDLNLPPGGATRFIDSGPGSFPITADTHALAEIHVSLGDELTAGDPVATLYDAHNLGAPPRPLTTPIDGIAAVIRRNPMVVPGDHICLVMPELPATDLP